MATTQDAQPTRGDQAARDVQPAPHVEPARAVTLDVGYTVDFLSNVRGGFDRGSRLLGLLGAGATFDGAAAGAPGVTGRLELQIVHGRGFSDALSGDAQVVSNIDASAALRPLEAWLALAFAGGRGVVRAGLIDLNGQFDVQRIGALFINSSHGIAPDLSQTGENGPSIFPTTTTAANIEYGTDRLKVRLGVFNAVSGDPDRPRRVVVPLLGRDGLLLIGEVESAIGGTRAYLGAWHYTSRFDLVEPVHRMDGRGNRGAYAAVEQRLLGQAEGVSLDGWLRVGAANPRYNPIGAYFGAGIAYGDDARRVGLAVAHARLGNVSRRAALATGAAADRAETNFELTGSFALSDQVTVQPDVQYIINPSWSRTRRDALVLGLRLSFTIL